jgi:aminoacrylate hydrolase
MPHAAGLYYEEHGPADGHPLILSAGLGGVGAYWAPNLPAFARHYRVIVYDHRGTGQSDRALPDRVTVDDLAADMVALMDGLSLGRAHIVGHALGGLAGMAAAFMDRVDKLVVVNGWVRLEPHSARCFEARLRILHGAGVRAYLEAQPIFLYPAAWNAQNGARIDREIEAQLAHFQGEAALEKRIAAARAFDMDELIEGFPIPMLAIAAEDDILVPWVATEAMMLTGTITRVLMPHGGHACNVTEPETFNRLVLEFLGS